MRAGHQEDPQKIWARDYFKDYLPSELSKYRYKASFGAVYDCGLEQAREDILEMCGIVNELTGLTEVHPSIMRNLINGFRAYDHDSEFQFLARLSYVSWIYQFHRENLIDLDS